LLSSEWIFIGTSALKTCDVQWGKLFALDNGHVLSIAVFDAVAEIIGIPNGGYLVYENQFIMRWRRLVIDIDHDTSSFEIFDLCVALELLAFVCNHDNSSPRAFARTNASNGSGGNSVLYACMGDVFAWSISATISGKQVWLGVKHTLHVKSWVRMVEEGHHTKKGRLPCDQEK
jgi:hypothetical protein